MRTLTLILACLMGLTAAAEEDPNEPGYDPAWEWVGDGENEWSDNRPVVEDLHYEVTADGTTRITMNLSAPVVFPDEVCARGTWVGNYIEVKLPFIKGPKGPKMMIESSSDEFSKITVEKTGELIGAVYKWYFAEPHRDPMVRVSFPWDSDGKTVVVETDLHFDPRRDTAPLDGWVCEAGSSTVDRPNNNDRFNTYETYEIISVTASGDEVRIVTSLEELEIHHQQDGTSFWGGQFELRHSGSGGTVLKAVLQDDTGHMRPVMSDNAVSLTKSLPKLTVVFTRGASVSSTVERNYSDRDTSLIRKVTVGGTSSMGEARVGVVLPVGAYAYEFWTEGGTLVIRAFSSEEFQDGQL